VTLAATTLYPAYEARRALVRPAYHAAAASSALLRPLSAVPPARLLRAFAETLSALEVTHRRPAYGIDEIDLDGVSVAVEEQIVAETPFASLVRFSKAGGPGGPPVLVLPGLAGHFGTLVRGTIRTMLSDHDVHVADWHNARDVPVSAGPFGLDEYVEHIIQFVRAMGPGVHVVAVCQPTVATLAAAALMAEDQDAAQPASLTLIAGPVDARVNPGPVNQFAERTSLEKLERTVITRVPWPHQGAGRRVYPGFIQVLAFMRMDPSRHMKAFHGLFTDIALGNEVEAARVSTFYDEYFAVLDVAADFYLDTTRVVFQDHDLARGHMTWRGRRVDPGHIRSALMTVEGELDELCCPGQTEAAHGLCTGVPKKRRRHHLQPGVGHYGVFSGSRFEREIYPEISSFIAAEEARRSAAAPRSG
jgi:polyhydroxyalkanoate depolymerase